MAVKKLGELLIEAGLLSDEQLAVALEQQKQERLPLGEILVRNGFCQDVDVAQTVAFQLNINYIELATTTIEPEAVQLVKEDLAVKYSLMPVCIDKNVLTIAMVDPMNLQVIEDLRFVTGCYINPAVSTPKEVESAIRHHYHISDALSDITMDMSPNDNIIELVQEQEGDLSDDLKKSKLPPIIKLVNSIITNAINGRAGDIHIEPQLKEVILRERVDGLLKDINQLPRWIHGAVTSRIKIMARMDITEKRLPQDGRIKIRIGEREVELRISTLPSQYGENIIIRILDPKSSVVNLDATGLSADNVETVKRLIEKPHGIVLVTGPTGSGKSSTLYAMINAIKSPAISIVTLEDPIEYELKGVTQVAINEKTGLPFAYGLRSILRQDSDVILLGEIRDQETAQIAAQASITGHLVISQHTPYQRCHILHSTFKGYRDPFVSCGRLPQWCHSPAVGEEGMPVLQGAI